MPEFIKTLFWAGVLFLAAYFLWEELRPPEDKEPPQKITPQAMAEEKMYLAEHYSADPKQLRKILLWYLASESRDTPGDVAQIFSRSKHPELFQGCIIEAIAHQNPLIRRNAAEVAGLMRLSAARPVLESRVQDASRDVQRAVVNALKIVGDERSLFALVLALKSSAWEIRLEAAEALGYHGGPKAIRFLWSALNDREPLVSDSAAAAIMKIAQTHRAKALPFLEPKVADPIPQRAELARRAVAVAVALPENSASEEEKTSGGT